MTQTQKHPIIVAGAGVGGLTTAVALARKGYRVQVLEQAEAIHPIGYGIQLGPNAFHMFDRLGMADSVLAACSFPEAGIMRDIVGGEEIGRLPMGDTLRERYGRPYAVIHRGDLHQALLDACAASEKVELVTSAKVTGYRDEGERVVVTAGGRQYTGEALVGADGVWSNVRTQLLAAEAKPQSLGYIAYRGLVTREELADDLFERNVNLWAGPGYHMMHYPLRSDQLFNIVAVFRSRQFAKGQAEYGGPDELEQVFSAACSHVRRLLTLVPTDKRWEISVMDPVPTWTSGRVALLGDAAHAMLQAMAQGACMAIEDGVWLAEHVAAAPGHCAQALSAYQQHRQMRAVRMQYQSRLYWEIYHAAGAYADLRKQMLQRPAAESIESVSWVYEKPDFNLPEMSPT